MLGGRGGAGGRGGHFENISIKLKNDMVISSVAINIYAYPCILLRNIPYLWLNILQ